jgi:putative membrane protein
VANLEEALPADMEKGNRSELDRLQKLNGNKFDQEFLKRAVDDHKKDIKEFEKQAEKGSDPALKEFAQNTLPALRQHLETAETIYRR